MHIAPWHLPLRYSQYVNQIVFNLYHFITLFPSDPKNGKVGLYVEGIRSRCYMKKFNESVELNICSNGKIAGVLLCFPRCFIKHKYLSFVRVNNDFSVSYMVNVRYYEKSNLGKAEISKFCNKRL